VVSLHLLIVSHEQQQRLPRIGKKAQLVDKECLNRLAEAARARLREYVQRLTLQEDLTEDIVQ